MTERQRPPGNCPDETATCRPHGPDRILLHELNSSADRRLLLNGALAPDASASLTHVPELHVHHGGHQGIVEGIILLETGNAQV